MTTKIKAKQITINIPVSDELKKRLQKKADKEKRKLSTYCRLMLEEKRKELNAVDKTFRPLKEEEFKGILKITQPNTDNNGDGEEIFDGDKEFWTVDKIDYSLTRWPLYPSEDGSCKSLIYFKSKEKATEYVLLNSPKLSVNDVLDNTMDEE